MDCPDCTVHGHRGYRDHESAEACETCSGRGEVLSFEERAFAAFMKTATNSQLKALSKDLTKPGVVELWKLSLVQREMARRGI
jgi:hypothetical protein